MINGFLLQRSLSTFSELDTNDEPVLLIHEGTKAQPPHLWRPHRHHGKLLLGRSRWKQCVNSSARHARRRRPIERGSETHHHRSFDLCIGFLRIFQHSDRGKKCLTRTSKVFDSSETPKCDLAALNQIADHGQSTYPTATSRWTSFLRGYQTANTNASRHEFAPAHASDSNLACRRVRIWIDSVRSPNVDASFPALDTRARLRVDLLSITPG
jgi:hypothetical protein